MVLKLVQEFGDDATGTLAAVSPSAMFQAQISMPESDHLISSAARGFGRTVWIASNSALASTA
jgi:hypothetical protein